MLLRGSWYSLMISMTQFQRNISKCKSFSFSEHAELSYIRNSAAKCQTTIKWAKYASILVSFHVQYAGICYNCQLNMQQHGIGMPDRHVETSEKMLARLRFMDSLMNYKCYYLHIYLFI